MAPQIDHKDSRKPRIVMVGCFDTKSEEFAYLYHCLGDGGAEVVAVNMGTMGSTDRFPIAFDAEEVARRANTDLDQIRKTGDRNEALERMGRGASHIVVELYADRAMDGIIGMGGGGGTFLAITAMKRLPFGVPKICVSTMATKDLSDRIGSKDITLVPSIVDIAGLNGISKVVIAQAAGALLGMVAAPIKVGTEKKGTVAMSIFGNTAICAERCSELLRAEGYEVMTFHAVGVGGRTMEALAEEGHFDAIIDLTTTELADELCGGICSAGPDRLNAGARLGIPQVIAPGCLDMVNFGAPETVPDRYDHRQIFRWAPDVTLMRTNKLENEQLGRTMAEKLNQSSGEVIMLFPLEGFSKIGGPGEAFHDPETDTVLLRTLKASLKEDVAFKEVPANLNTVDFADVAVASLLELIERNALSEKGPNTT